MAEAGRPPVIFSPAAVMNDSGTDISAKKKAPNNLEIHSEIVTLEIIFRDQPDKWHADRISLA
jgi:hypothetical protein